MKAHLLYRDRDFDFAVSLPAQHEDLVFDLELGTLLEAMALGDKFLFEVARKVMLTHLTEPEAIRYRQRVLADCVARPGIIRQMYDIAVGALADSSSCCGQPAFPNVPGSSGPRATTPPVTDG